MIKGDFSWGAILAVSVVLVHACSSVSAQCESPVSRWPVTSECSGEGTCENNVCICNSGFSGKQDFVDLSGLDCSSNDVARRILHGLASLMTGITSAFAVYRLYGARDGFLPFSWPIKPKQLGALLIFCQYFPAFLVFAFTSIGNLVMSDNFGLIFLFGAFLSFSLINTSNQCDSFVKVATYGPAKTLYTSFHWFLWIDTGITVFCIIVSLGGNFFASDPKVKDIFIACLGGSLALVCLSYTIAFFKFGRDILIVLQTSSLESGADSQRIIKSVNVLKNQLSSVCLIVGFILAPIAFVPLIRSVFSEIAATVAFLVAISDFQYLLGLKVKKEETSLPKFKTTVISGISDEASSL